MISKIVNIEDVYSFLTDFYSCDYDDLPFFKKGTVYSGSQAALENFHYSDKSSFSTSLNNDACKFFFLINEDEHEIVAIIKFADVLVGEKGQPYFNFTGCMYYLEISQKYQGKKLLKQVTNAFADAYPKHIFVSNNESTDGRRAKVNHHLMESFTKKGLYFFSGDRQFIRDYFDHKK